MTFPIPAGIPHPDETFWPNGARLAITVAMQFEAGGQPLSGAPGPISDPIRPGLPDLPTNTFFEYGVVEGIPRMLDLFDRHGIRVTSFMIGAAVAKHPEVAREIVRRGHEAAAHGREWSSQYHLTALEERLWIADSVEAIERVTGQRPLGYNAYWIRDSAHTLELLQDLGFIYHIDDLSRDAPFTQMINGQCFVTVPYTVHMNDIASYNFSGYDPIGYEQALKDEFDQLYAEGGTRRRMMNISLHDRISGHANRVRVLDRFFAYANDHPKVWFARKDEIARWALATPRITPRVKRAPVSVSGLPSTSR